MLNISGNNPMAPSLKSFEKAEIRYQALFDSSFDAISIVDPQTGRFIDCNRAALNLHRMKSRENFIGLKPSQLSPKRQPDGQLSEQLAEEHITAALSEGVKIFDWTHCTVEGAPVNTIVTLSPMELGNKKLVIAIVRDITEKRESEALRRFQAQILDQIHDSVISVDMEGFITSWNKGSKVLFHYSKSEIIGKHVSLLYPESFHGYLHNEVIPTLLTRGSHGYDIPLVRKDGTEFMARVSLSVLKNETGEINGMIGYTLDITDQKRAETELQLSEERFRAIFESTKDCILVWDRQYNYLYANQAAIDHVGTTRDKVIGKNIRDGLRHVPDFMHLWMERIDQVFETEKPLRVEDAVPVSAKTVHSESVLSPIFSNDGSMFAVGVVYRDVTERKFMEEELKRLAATDPLTGADNRRSFLEKATYELLRSQRYKHPFALLMLDVDHFKSVNDMHGHKWGDQVLKTIVAESTKTLRDTDLFGRIGGEEFTIILPESDPQAALEVGERLRQTLSEIKISTDRGAIQITVSIGLAMMEARDDTLDTIMGRADAALYKAKQAGRNKLVRG